jgi:hypothetical protein
MSTWKFARRAAVALALVVCSAVFVTAADKGEAPRPSTSGATNSIVVESQVLMVGIPGSTVGVSLTNTIPLAGLVVPLEIRPLTAGVPLAQTIVYQMNPTGRVALSPLGYADDVDSLWPEATRVVKQSCVVCSVGCSGPTSNTYCVIDTLCEFTINPYGLFFGTVSTGDPQVGESITMDPGADPGTSEGASLQIVLTQIGTTPGFFEIDTCCWRPANSVAFAEASGDITVPEFTKGIIEIRCDCTCHTDPICDGIQDVTDVVQAIDIAFRNEAEISQPYCPFSTIDTDCNDVIDILDIVNFIDVSFRNGDPDVLYCDACAP